MDETRFYIKFSRWLPNVPAFQNLHLDRKKIVSCIRKNKI